MAKTFVLSDESLNSYGFWIKTDGIDLSQFKINPIMLWMHARAFMGTKNEVLPIGRWENIRIENGQLLADAVFDMSDPFAASIAAKVESGFLKMASIGVKPIAFDDSPELMKPGQTDAVVTKSKAKEASIVDIGGNDNAVALYDEEGNIYDLNDKSKASPIPKIKYLKSENKMSKELNTLLKLADGADETAQVAAIKLMQTNLSDKDTKIAELTGKVNDYEAKEQTARKESAKLMLAGAVKDGRIDAPESSTWEKLFDKDFEGAKLALEKLPKRQSIADKLKDTDEENKDVDYNKLSWDELDKGNYMEDVKLNHPDLYKQKFKQKFGKEPKI